MIQILDDRTQKFIDFLNTHYGSEEVVRLSIMNGYDAVMSDDTSSVGFAVYLPTMKMMIIPTEIPESIKELNDDELMRDFIIHNLAHEYAHFLQDIGKLEGFNNKEIIEQVADDFADKTVAEFAAIEQSHQQI